MATAHEAQAPFLAKQIVSCTVGFSIVLSKHCAICEYLLILFKKCGKLYNKVQFAKAFSARFPVDLICQTFLLPKVLPYDITDLLLIYHASITLLITTLVVSVPIIHLKQGYENIIATLWLYTECHFYTCMFIHCTLCILYAALVLLLFYSGDVELSTSYIKGLTKTVTYTYIHILGGFGLCSVCCTYIYIYIFVATIITCCCVVV